MIKSTAIDPSLVDADGVYRKTGPARVFIGERAGIQAIRDGRVQPGDIMAVICAGPLGSGMEETLQVTGALKTLSWGKHVAVLTDGRFSGVSTGACIGHIGPEALAGGPIGKLHDGDIIQIVIDRKRLEGSIDLVGEADTPAGKQQPGVGQPDSGQASASARSRAVRRHAGRYPAVGGPPGNQRRHLGRLRLRHPANPTHPGGGPA